MAKPQNIYFYVRVDNKNVDNVKELIEEKIGRTIFYSMKNSRLYFKPLSVLLCNSNVSTVLKILRNSGLKDVKVGKKDWMSYAVKKRRR